MSAAAWFREVLTPTSLLKLVSHERCSEWSQFSSHGSRFELKMWGGGYELDVRPIYHSVF